jgi:hypothetical protein
VIIFLVEEKNSFSRKLPCYFLFQCLPPETCDILLHSVFVVAGQLANELADDSINRTEGVRTV